MKPFGEAELPAAAREQAARSALPLAMAKALHRYAVKAEPPRDTYIDPDTGCPADRDSNRGRQGG